MHPFHLLHLLQDRLAVFCIAAALLSDWNMALLQSPILQGEAATQNALFIDYCMELYGRNYRLQTSSRRLRTHRRGFLNARAYSPQTLGIRLGITKRQICVPMRPRRSDILHEMLAFRDASVFVPNQTVRKMTQTMMKTHWISIVFWQHTPHQTCQVKPSNAMLKASKALKNLHSS